MKRLQMRLVLLLLIAVIALACPLVLLRYLWAVLTAPERAWRIALAFDRVGNAATNGLDTETLSSRADKARANGRRWGCVLCRLLDYAEADHCTKSRGV